MEKMIKLERTLNSWLARRLTLLGKITIIKSLAVSIYYQPFLPLKEYYKKINLLWYEFFWGSKSEKIKRTEMIIVSTHLWKWVQSYLNTDNKGKWKNVLGYYLKKHGGKLLFQGNLKKARYFSTWYKRTVFERNRRAMDQYKLYRKEPGFQLLVHLA